MNNNKKQIFSLYHKNNEAGLFYSYVPNTSARKIFRGICQKLKIADNEEIEFTIINVETKKIYKYYGKKELSNKVLIFKKFGIEKKITVKYLYKVKRLYN